MLFGRQKLTMPNLGSEPKTMITVKELLETLKDIPGHYKVWLTLPNDELPVACVTQDRASIHICTTAADTPVSERTIYIDTEA